MTLDLNRFYTDKKIEAAKRFSDAVKDAYFLDDEFCWPSYVYFLQCGDYIKIGSTRVLVKRIETIDACIPHDLTLLGVTSGDIALEKSLHSDFHEYRFKKEWFERCVPILNYVSDHCEQP